MFGQSNFGIVTQLAFRLMQKPERCCLFWGVARNEELERIVDTVDLFGRQGAINRGRVNAGYANRFVQAERALRPGVERAAGGEEVWNFYVLVPGMSIDQMQRLVESRPDFFDLVARLKSVLDPNGIIAPGRYSATTPRP